MRLQGIVLLALNVGVFTATEPPVVAAEGTDVRERAHLVVGFHTIGPIIYGAPQETAGLFMEGEPLLLDIGLTNPYRDRDVAAEVNWPDLIALTVRTGRVQDEAKPGSTVSFVCQVGVTPPSRNVRVSGPLILLGPEAMQYVKCEIPATLLTSGVYTITVGWRSYVDVDTLKPPTVHVVSHHPILGPSTADFELRAVLSTADASDRSTRLALHAMMTGNLSEAEQFVADALRTNPLNAEALATAGRVALKRQDCMAASRDLNNAADILVGFLDGEDRSELHRPELRPYIARDWRAAATAGCP